MIDIKQVSTVDELINFSKLIRTLIGEDVSVAVCDRETFIAISPSIELNLPIKIGMKIPSGSGLRRCMDLKKDLNEIVPKEVYGKAFRAVSIPIVDDDQVIGGIAVARSLETRNQVIHASENLVGSLDEIAKSIGDVASNAQQIAVSQGKMVTSAEEALACMQETYQVLDFIKTIANQTNLLGLNASIEAARSGDDGRGFAVVANEIRKLSITSNEAVNKISQTLKKSDEAVKKIVDEIENNSSEALHQAAATEQINAAVEELNSIATIMVSIGNML